jgi:hypothetical protein
VRAFYKYWAALVFLGVLVQFGFAGYGAFFASSQLEDKGDVLGHKPFDHAWSFHTAFGYVVVLAILILLLAGFAAKVGRTRIWFAVALAVAGVIQIPLAYLGEDHAKAGFLHPLNALVIFGLSGLIAHRSFTSSAA